jgi:hypothetical protein
MESVKVFINNQEYQLPLLKTFLDLKKYILTDFELFVTRFSSDGAFLADALCVSNFTNKNIMAIVDTRKYDKHGNNQFRCSLCRNSIKLTTMKCSHKSNCRNIYFEESTIEVKSDTCSNFSDSLKSFLNSESISVPEKVENIGNEKKMYIYF